MCHRVWVIGFGLLLFWPGVDIYSESQTIDITLSHLHIGPIFYLGSSKCLQILKRNREN